MNSKHFAKYFTLYALIAAAILACYQIYLEHGRINDDGVLYIEAARLFAAGEWSQGYAIYPWPFYSLLIAAMHKLTGLNLQYSGHLLAILFFTLSTYMLIKIIALAEGSKGVILAGLVLLFTNSYVVVNILTQVMRDQGYWAFFLMSIYFFIHFYQTNRWRDAISWQLSAIVAALFRIEGIVFLALLPAVLLWQPEFSIKQKLIRLLQAYILNLLLLALLICVLLAKPSLHLSDLGRLNDIVTVLQGSFTTLVHGLNQKAHVMGQQVLGSFLDGYALQGLLFTLIVIIFGKVGGASGWLALIIKLAARPFKLDQYQPLREVMPVLRWALILAVLNISVILLHQFIAPGRLAIPAGLILIIMASFSLFSLYEWIKVKRWQTDWVKMMFALFVVVWLVAHVLINVKPRPAGYNEEQQAVVWIKAHIKPNETVFYDQARTRYYAGEKFTERGISGWDAMNKALSNGSLLGYDYIVLEMSERAPEREAFLATHIPHKEVASIKSNKKLSFKIYKKP